MILKRLPVFLFCFMCSGCWFSSHPLPMPQNESQFSKPIQKPLRFSAPRKIKWNDVPADSIHPGHIIPFDISKFPSRPFNPTGMTPLSNPAIRESFQYDKLPDTILNLDAIPSEPIIYKTSLMGNIKKTILGQPRLRTESYYSSFEYSDDQGLPGQSVESILHTRNGFCWIFTSRGLSVLNGESLETFPTIYGDCFYMAEDTLGQVWLRTIRNGVFVINRKTGIQKQIMNFQTGVHIRIDKKGFVWVGSFTDGLYLISPDQKSFKHITRKNGLVSNETVVTYEDHKGRIWVANQKDGVDILDPSLQKIKRLGAAQGLRNDVVLNMTENRTGDVFIGGANKGLEIINIGKGTYKRIDSAQGFKKSSIYNMLEDPEGRMWVSSDSAGVYILSRNEDSIANISNHEAFGDGPVQCLDKDRQGRIYIGSLAGGMNIFPPADRIAHHLSTKQGILDDNVWAILRDSKQRIWIGTYGGLNIITPDKKITAVLVNPPLNQSNRTEDVLQIGPDQFLICGPTMGLCLIDEEKHTLEKIGLKEGMPTNNLRYLMQDSQGQIWITSNRAGIIRFDLKKRTIRYLNQASGLSSAQVSGVQEVEPGRFWISTYSGGIDNLDLIQNTISTYSTKEGLSSDQVVGIYRDSKKRSWIYTEKGLNLVDSARETNTIFSIFNGMSANSVYSLIEKDNRLYAGTQKGLTILDETTIPKSGADESVWNLHAYGKSIGFFNLDFNGHTVAQSRGQFWWGIFPGISILNESELNNHSVLMAPRVNGLDILGKDQYFTDAGSIENTDTVWSDNKDTFYLNDAFKELNADKQKGIEWESLSPINMPVGLSLPHDQNNLRFHFANYLPQYAGDYQYQYILDGVDEKWSPVTDLPVSENYNNISPGHYTFRASIKRGNGNWSTPSEFHIRIRPPWWFSWWAELIYFLIFIGLLRLWVRQRSLRLLNENAWLEQKVAERTEALSQSLENLRQTQGQLIQAEKMASLGELTAGIAHEIQNPLNFVNNFSEVNTELLEDISKSLDDGNPSEAKSILKDIEMNMGKITFHGKRADAIVKGMLLHSRASSGQKVLTNINMLADEYLRLSYHGLRARDKSFNARFVMDFDEKTGELMLVQQDIGRVLLNLFNNAFYSVTEKKKQLEKAVQPGDTVKEIYEPMVSVSTKRKKDSVEIRIRDNGQGIPKKVIDKIFQPFFTTKPAGQGTGLGLSLSYDIITKEHNGKIDVTTKENEYTEFIIELPAHAT
jgi:signal transduction histidine kinase/ligand-binding sensor domain-containing protein